ncbi:MAG: heme ABC exporter ATP-binding protein CcmA, partial [Proteobacteria bacterium]|nr:heme ABC exporter ATP-binding protein CcmA [Pseudomonadota bacterium]
SLLGPSGSGKRTLLNLLGGLDTADSGVVRVAGDDLTQLSEEQRTSWRSRNVGFVFQQYHLIPVLSAAENLAFWAAIRGGADAAGAAVDALQRLGIGHLAEVPGRFLSAGQKRRVNLARVLTAPAGLWLLDEPQTALDSQAAKSLETAIADHRRDGGMVVVASHAEAGLKDAVTLDLGDFQAKLLESTGTAEESAP